MIYGDTWRSPHVQALIHEQNCELRDFGIATAYVTALSAFTGQVEARVGKDVSTEGMRRSCDLKGLLLAGVNEYGEVGETGGKEFILLQIRPEDGVQDYFSKIEVASVVDDQIQTLYDPFTKEQLRVLERHVQAQHELGVRISQF